jgi:hypothetical protein
MIFLTVFHDSNEKSLKPLEKPVEINVDIPTHMYTPLRRLPAQAIVPLPTPKCDEKSSRKIPNE